MTMIHAGPEAHGRDTQEGFRPIADYGLLADCNSAALVDRDGSIGWLCLPRYDSPAVFAQILDPEGGHWQIKPTGAYGPDTRAAIEKFERERKLPITGQISDRLVRELAALTGEPLE